MKKIISALLAASLLVVPVAASAHDHDRYEHRDRSNGVLPFIAGAVVGGIIVDSARKDSRPTYYYAAPPLPPTYYTAPDYYPAETVVVLNRYYVYGRGTCETREIRDAYGRWLRTEQVCY